MKPDSDLVILQRLGFGHSREALDHIKKIGVKQYVEEQLYPGEETDGRLKKKLAQTKLLLEYEHKRRKVRENRLLQYLDAPLALLWKLTGEDTPYSEKYRPVDEVSAATILRAVYSRWQLREVMVDFWHNHFNVNVEADERIAITLPLYDREIIRRHCFGNFREMLEAVASSTAMLYYLDNVYSKASPANENYARELFELHTLGADHYLNHLYNRWREVPGALEGNPAGYIDEDVYEAARAFTGWTVANGASDEKGGTLPDTGAFHYYEGWHDHYQKRLLGVELPPNQPPLADARKTLDLTAFHPATARHLCTKLCRRLVADDPPASLVEEAVSAWLTHRESPDQIRHVIRVIVFSETFSQTWKQKVKTPLELAVAFWRATDADVTPTSDFFDMLAELGQHLFRWPSPTGHPDRANYWINTHRMLGRWNLISTLLLEDWHGACKIDEQLLAPLPDTPCLETVETWALRILGYLPEPAVLEPIAHFYAAGGSLAETPVFETTEEERYRMLHTIALIAQTPDFQYK